ncbi:lipopolysaccharide assembly protein LapB [Bacillus sp. MMSF_3328]|uniref:tetratricopeptide repeat protein n=1 Tax=Bacillus sp. MMSF_3328 TaxID=3047080 RepID=UPI00273D560F|nr:tetratricopeptide repeat protein [Bacillus sp. MMSF_3328]
MSKDSKARQPMGKLLTFIPTGEYYFSKGIKSFHRRDFHKASKYLQRAMQLEPGEPMIACQLAIVYTELNEYQKSNKLLHLVLEELDEEMAECHYFLANNYAHLGFFKDAYQHANTYLELEPDGEFIEDTEDLLELLTLEAEDLDEELYEQDDLITKQEQARELLESGHFPKAVEILSTVIEDYPEYWSAYNNLALAHFYLGEVNKANDILDEVLVRNQGNLHALCNKLVFAYYQHDLEEVKALIETLKKIQPLLIDHQFKLGATFALVGEYEPAYKWLRKLHKSGYEGDGAFYYWLSYSSYFTGKEDQARNFWKRVLEYSPEKAGLEPWNEDKPETAGFEDHLDSIYKKMNSEYAEERLFALFLASKSGSKDEILASKDVKQNPKFTSVDREYASLIEKGAPEKNSVNIAHETAELLYKHHKPIGTVEAGLYLAWFTVFNEAEDQGLLARNAKAWAGAVEYVWRKQRSEKVSQQSVAAQYGLSASTLQKYVKSVSSFLK